MTFRSDEESNQQIAEALAALRRFARPPARLERCELCSAPLAEMHQHLLNRSSRQVACACDACSILFCGQEGGKFLRIPRRVKRLEEFAFSDIEWEAMMLPINLAFFLRNADGKLVAMYPSPAGAIESQIDLDSLELGAIWHTRLPELEPEVEALLVNRIAEQRGAYVVPLDECYRLVGLVKLKWRGLSGGAEVWTAINGFFSELDAKSSGMPVVQHA